MILVCGTAMNSGKSMAAAISSGLPKMRIEEASARRQAHIDSGREIIVGVNRYRRDHEDPLEILEVDNSEVRRQQLSRLPDARQLQPRVDAIRSCPTCIDGLPRWSPSGISLPPTIR